MKKVQRDDRWFVDEFEWLQEGEEKELNLVLLQLDTGVFQSFHIVLHCSVIGILWNCDPIVVLFVVIQYLDKWRIYLMNFNDFAVEESFLKKFYSHKSKLFAYSKVTVLLHVFALDLALLNSEPLFTLFLKDFVFLFEQRMQAHFGSVFPWHFDKVFEHFVFGELENWAGRLSHSDFFQKAWKRVLIVFAEWESVVPGKLDAIFSDFDVIFISIPVNSLIEKNIPCLSSSIWPWSKCLETVIQSSSSNLLHFLRAFLSVPYVAAYWTMINSDFSGLWMN